MQRVLLLCNHGNELCYSVIMAVRSIIFKFSNAFSYSVTRQGVLLFYNNGNSLSYSVTVATRFVNCKHINAFGHSVTMTTRSVIL